MIFTMNAQDLLEGLNTVTRALSARPSKQILEGVLISAEDNRVQLTCSDGSLVIEYTNAASIEEEGQAVLPGRLFAELIRKMPNGMVSVSVKVFPFTENTAATFSRSASASPDRSA